MRKKGTWSLALMALFFASPILATDPIPTGRCVLVVPPEAYDPKLKRDVIADQAPRELWSVVLAPAGRPFSSKEKCDVMVASMNRVMEAKVKTNPSPRNQHDLRMAKLARCEKSDGSARFIPGIRHLDDVRKPHVDKLSEHGWPY